MSAWDEWKKNLGDSRPWHLLSSEVEKVDEEIATKRYSICQSCPELIKTTKQCKKCGCLMTLKVKLGNAECPLGKW